MGEGSEKVKEVRLLCPFLSSHLNNSYTNCFLHSFCNLKSHTAKEYVTWDENGLIFDLKLTLIKKKIKGVLFITFYSTNKKRSKGGIETAICWLKC